MDGPADRRAARLIVDETHLDRDDRLAYVILTHGD